MLSTSEGASAYGMASIIDTPTCASTSVGKRNYCRLSCCFEECSAPTKLEDGEHEEVEDSQAM